MDWTRAVNPGTMLKGRNIVCLSLSVFAVYLCVRRRWFQRRRKVVKGQVVVVTGCDSGLGYSLALHFLRIGLGVVAGCLDPDPAVKEEFEKAAKSHDSSMVVVRHLDITDQKSVDDFVKVVEERLKEPGTVLLGVVNNAGVMTFGEFEWQTERIVQRQVEVNLLGTMRTTKAFLPLLRKHKGRLVNVLSHCSTEGLPGLSVYCASKAALNGWSDALRAELRKFGVSVVKIVPGGFIASSRLLAGQKAAADEMESAMSPEASSVYSGYFSAYMGYLGAIPLPEKPVPVPDTGIYRDLEDALLSADPKDVYKIAPLRYRFYYGLFQVLPARLRDWAALKFMAMPEYERSRTKV